MNFIKYIHHVLVVIEVFDSCIVLDKIKKLNIKIYNFNQIDKYHYSFITQNKYVKVLKENFKSLEIKNKIGLINILYKNIIRISTIISIITSLLLFNFMNNLIMDVKINGNASSLYNVINNKLVEYNIRKYSKLKSNSELLSIEKEISIELYDLIEWIEIKNQGLNVYVNFIKRRESFKNKNTKNAIYATKEGIIKSFDIEKGVKMVNINDYVYPGQLLISGNIVDSKDNNITIGALGSVYAYTWLNISLKYEITYYQNEVDIYTNLYNQISSIVDKELTGDDEYIDNEHFLKFNLKNNIATMQIHYTLVEDITR